MLSLRGISYIIKHMLAYIFKLDCSDRVVVLWLRKWRRRTLSMRLFAIKWRRFWLDPPFWEYPFQQHWACLRVFGHLLRVHWSQRPTGVRRKGGVSLALMHKALLEPYCPGTLASTWACCHIRKIVVCACAGNAGNVFPATDFKGNRQLAITACITACAVMHVGIANPHWQGKRSGGPAHLCKPCFLCS